MSLPKVIGLTGGIGSGKSTVADIIRSFGCPVYEADKAAKVCIDENTKLQTEIKKLLGEEAFSNGQYNRAFVSQKVFKDPSLLQSLNQIIHPAVQEHFKNWLLLHKTPFVFKEAAILFESGAFEQCDQIVVVTAPKEQRIQRVVQRDGASEEQVLARMENQWPEEDKIARADFVIENTATPEALTVQVQTILKQLDHVYPEAYS